ncbi:MAG: exosome complex protein Rrp4 [Candidatus Micrarchaeia archaeon]
MAELVAKIVVPGEKLFDAPKYIPGAYVEGGKTYSSILALFNEEELRLVPLCGPYIPAIDDIVVGVVEEVKFAGYTVEIKSAYRGFLSTKETRDEFRLGDVIVARVKGVDEVNNVQLVEARKLVGGEIVEITAAKVPRVIGRKRSMLNLIREATKSEIIIGNNGRAWIKGGNTSLATQALLKIEKEAHTKGLTDRMAEFLRQEGEMHGKAKAHR